MSRHPKLRRIVSRRGRRVAPFTDRAQIVAVSRRAICPETRHKHHGSLRSPAGYSLIRPIPAAALPKDYPMPRETIIEAATRLLRAHRTRTTDQITADLVARGLSRAKDPAASVTRQLRWDARFHHLGDDRWILVEALLAIAVSHRVTPEEAASDCLAVGADLAQLPPIRPLQFTLPTGETLRFLRGDASRVATGVDTRLALRGPAGWLEGFAGSLVRITAQDRVIRIEPVPAPRPSSRMRAHRLVEATRRQLEANGPGVFGEPVTTIGVVILDLLADEPDFLVEPLPPFGELFEGTGLEAHRNFIGFAGRDWSELDRFEERVSAAGDEDEDLDDAIDDDVDADDDGSGFDDEALAALAETFDLDDQETTTLGIVLDLYLTWRVPLPDGACPADSPTMRRNLAELVGLERVALALAEYAWTDPGLEAFVVDLRTGASRGRLATGPEFLLGACADARASIEEGERHYREALAVDPGFWPARVPLHRNEIDRGNYAAALVHLRALGIPADHPSRAWLETLVRPAVEKVGRNEPCPCGSGRKFKACHLGQVAPDAAPDPADALFRKLSMFVEQPDVHEALIALVHEAIGGHRAGDPTHSKDEAAAEALMLGDRNDLTVDVLLFDRGWFDRFLAVRGPLLPLAERALAEAWRSTRRGLFEVQSVRPGSGIVLQDIARDSAPIDVADRSLSRTVQPLDLALLRLRPNARGHMIATDGINVPRTQRAFVTDLVRANDEIGQMRWIAFPAPPPQMQNMEGEPLLLVTATYRLPDPAAARGALGRSLRADGDDVFTETVIRRSREWTRGSIRIEGDIATIDTNSAKRANRLVRHLLKAAPGSRLIKREERGLDEALAEHGGRAGAADEKGAIEGVGVAGTGILDPAEHPELQVLLGQMMRDLERRWIDERIPALGGRTPRGAMLDPAGRREVLALLDDMAWSRRQAAGTARNEGMDPDRIRALLGLPGTHS